MRLNNGDQLVIATKHSSRFQCGLYFNRMMAVIINDGDAIADAFGFKSAANPAKCGQCAKNA